MKAEKMVLIISSAIACAWVAKMVADVAGLARHQDIPARAAIFDLSTFPGA
jgi:hypothetical protein